MVPVTNNHFCLGKNSTAGEIPDFFDRMAAMAFPNPHKVLAAAPCE